MSRASTSVTVAGVGSQPPFTAAQWKELEHQALIYKYLMAGLPVPPDLLVPIRRSLESMSARFFQNPSLAYCSYYGKKFDPEPGRCRRTDGKKWRCSKDAYPDSKYCERHMRRGRVRSRKPVESQSNSQSSSAVLSHVTGSSGGSVSFQNLPSHSTVNSEAPFSGSTVPKLQMEPSLYGMNNKEYRYFHGLIPETEEHNFSSEASGSVKRLGVDSNIGNTCHLVPSQGPVSPFLKASCGSQSASNPFEPMMDAAASKQRQQHWFFGTELGSTGPVQQEHPRMGTYFDEWSSARDSWSELDDQRSNSNAFSTTQLSISTPMAPSEYSARSACSPKSEFVSNLEQFF